jgi:hypothetical protein
MKVYKSKKKCAPSIMVIACLLLSNLFFLSSCTKDITVSLPHQEDQITVEGHIETGVPPYVILTKSSDFYSTF